MALSSQEKAFEQLYAQHFYKVRYFAFNYMGDMQIAEDVAQEAFVRAWEGRDKIDYQKDVLPYLITIAKNICMNLLKRDNVRKRYGSYAQQSFIDDINSEALSELPVSSLYSAEVEKILAHSLNEMPQSIKETYLLNKVKGHKYKEIAQIQNISIKTVEWRIAGAMRILQKRFKDYLPFLLSFLFR